MGNIVVGVLIDYQLLYRFLQTKNVLDPIRDRDRKFKKAVKMLEKLDISNE